MKKLTSSQWDKIERNPFNSFKKIGWYNTDRNCFEEVARWRNTYGTTGANFGMLNIWSPLFDAHFSRVSPDVIRQGDIISLSQILKDACISSKRRSKTGR